MTSPIEEYKWDFEGTGTWTVKAENDGFKHTYKQPATDGGNVFKARFCAVVSGTAYCDSTTVTVTSSAPVLSGSITLRANDDRNAKMFTASAADMTFTDADGDQIDTLQWDLDNDGVYETKLKRIQRVTFGAPVGAWTDITIRVRGQETMWLLIQL